MTRDRAALHAVKVVHTLVWALFAGCILAIPVMTWRGRLGAALVLSATVSAEVLVLAANHMRCPLTGIAARFTDDRSDNFDIYLPLWLARYNKAIFGSLFVAGVLVLIARWRGWLS
ncbi:MAG TPA: hypothetical protein VGQ52_17775 [Gemmatimonadaceae bacterium]|nr:hypothetical protein [Gemmatimonadaceae bacterium]